MKSLKHLAILLCIMLGYHSSHAAVLDPGDSCSVAIYLGGVPDTSSGYIADNRNEAWFSFQSIYPTVEITVTNLTVTPGLYNKVVLYKGVCGGLAPLDSAESFGDTIFTLTRQFMVADVYYIKVSKPEPCKTCPNPVATADLRIVQKIDPWCGFDQRMSFVRNSNPSVQFTSQDAYIFNYINTHSTTAGPFTIPVVVHVIHYGDGYGSGNNIDYDQIKWQIAAMNAAFQHDYANYNQQGYGHTYASIGYRDYSSNPQVRFCLAERGRDSALNVVPFFYNTMTGDTECGVMRYDLTQGIYSTIPNIDSLNSYLITSAADEQTLLDVTRPGTEFPNDMYFNIYLVPEMCDTTGNPTNPCGVIGMGMMGEFTSLTGQFDGVVFRSDVFGDNSVVGNNFPLLPILDQGKIMDHEAGHYLSLYHPFQPDTLMPIGCYGMQLPTASSDQCDQHGDYCCDTPPDANPFVQPYQPVAFLNSCAESYFPPAPLSNHADMNENYMDYSDDEWYNTFTFDQSMRISAMLDVGGPRHSLVTPANHALTGVTDSGQCSCCLLVAQVIPNHDTICPTASVNFYTPSGNAFCATSWTWTFPGGSPSSGSGPNISVTYNSVGTYPVYLVATNGVDTVMDTSQVVVIIPTASITGVNTLLTVCNGEHENIHIHFTGNMQPYSVSICDQNNNIVAVMDSIYCDSAIVLVTVSDTSNVFHICSVTNGLGCNLDTINGTDFFIVQECCPNLFKDGDFEDWGIGCTIFPSTTQQVTTPTCNIYTPSYYGVYDPTVGFGSWPVVPENDGINGLSMSIDCWGVAQDCTMTPMHTELWCQAVQLEFGVPYSIQFDCSGHHAGLGGLFPPSAFLKLMLQIKIDGVFIGTPFEVPFCSDGTPWHTEVQDWISNLPTGTHNICLCQVQGPPGFFYFSGGSFDFLIDNLVIRAKDIPIVDAGQDTTICPGGIANIGSPLNDSDGAYLWNPVFFVACDTCFYTTANPDSTFEYVLTNQQGGCIVRDTVVVSVLHVSLGNDTAFCDYASVSLTPTVSGNAGSLTYLWQPGGQTTSSITVSPVIATTYIVTVSDSTAGCTDSDTIVVTPVNLNADINDTIICSGDTVTLTPVITGNISTITYLWLPGNQTTTSISVSPTSTTSYSVVVTDSLGCTDTAVAIVTIDNVAVSFPGSTICSGDSTTLSANVTGGYPNFTFLWQPGSQTASSITVSPSANTIYSVTVTDSIGCSATYQDTVLVGNLVATLSDFEFCAGDSVTLSPSLTGGNPSFTYSWSPGGQTTSSITVAPSIVTIYTVTVTDANGCSDTATSTVTPNDLSATLSDKTICNGQTVFLAPLVTGGNPSYTYLWLPGNQNTPSISDNPSVTTTYTVIVTDSTGCSDTAQATVTVNPAPTVTASANPNPACLGSFIQLQANATGTTPIAYSWLPATNLNNSATATPTITSYNGTTITYTVFISDALGCSAMDSVQIVLDPNCCAAQSNAPDTLFSGITGGQYAVNQDLYISGNITISGTEMLMAPNVSIIVLTGSTLTINAQSHLHACIQMWQGIILRPGANLIITGSSLVEDAYTAVNYNAATGATINLVNAIFNKNQFAVLGQTWTGLLGFNMINCRVTCRTLPASPTVASLTPAVLTGLPQSNLMAPLTAQRAYTGVQFMNGGSANVGALGTTNIFDYMDHGIVVTNTNIIIRNNRFQNMLQPCVGPPTCANNAGAAIIANDLPTIGNPSTYNTIIVGGSTSAGNTFVNCWRSVDITRYINTTVRNNTIFSTSTVINPPNLANLNGDHGIFIRTTYALVMDVYNNDIRNQARGIHISLSAGGLGYNTINVRDNKVLAGNAATTFTTTGIQVDGVAGVFFITNNFLNIEGDTVLNANTCIQVRNIRNAVRIFSNPELSIRPNPTTTPGPNKTGIAVRNCEAVFIQDNLNIHSTGTALDSNNRNIRGIWVFNCAQSIVCNNWIQNVGQCLVFEGSCQFSTVRLDRFSNSYDGFVMRNNAIIGQQGNNTHPWDCRFLTGLTNHTYVYFSPGVNTNSGMFVRSTAPYIPTINSTFVPLQDYAPIPVGPIFIAAACGTTPPTFMNQQALRQAIAQNQITYNSYPSETRVANQRRLYNELNGDPALMLGDTILQNFYASNTPANLGFINSAEDEVEQGNSSSATAYNSNITALTNSEWNQQVFNTIFLATLMQGIDTLTSQQTIDLTAIAEQCPNQGGDAVWQARALIDWMTHSANDFVDSCSGETTRLIGHETTAQPQTSVYPNPNSGSVTVQYRVPEFSQVAFEVLDLTGRVILVVALDSQQSQQTVDLGELADGPYIYKITGDGDLIDTGTLIISK